jgi:TRAP-type uncharacterized transport system substrate-binding protein
MMDWLWVREGRHSMRRIIVAAFAVVSTLVFGSWFVGAQEIPKALQGSGTEAEMKERLNAWAVGIAGGNGGGTAFDFIMEIRKVLDDGDNMRVLPVVTRGVSSNLDDLLYLRGIDLAFAQSDAFEYYRTERKIANLDKRINYILRFPVAEVHVIARTEFKRLEDLRGKRVDFGPPGTSGSLTAPIIFQRLGIKVQQVKLQNPFTPQAYMKIAAGELDAAVRVSGKPLSHVAKVPPNSGLHLIPIPYSKTFTDFYALAELTSEDYPTLVPQGQRVDTLSVPSVLAVYNWPKNHERYKKVERFVTRLFENWERLRQPPYLKKWRDINLAATVPGWNRFSAAEEQLEKMVGGQTAVRRDFQSFLTSASRGGNRQPSQEEREALFNQFLEWRERRGGAAR